MVSNHLSYLDILAFSAAVPCVFVSKAEVNGWAIIGRYARWAGTVFVVRHDRSDAARANVSVGESLQNGVPVVLFPEGTTTDGQRVLRFHSTMLQPAIDAGAPITPCAITYELDEGNVGTEVCWWGEMPLLPHFWNLMGKKIIRAHVAFGEPVAAVGRSKATQPHFASASGALARAASGIPSRPPGRCECAALEANNKTGKQAPPLGLKPSFGMTVWDNERRTPVTTGKAGSGAG